MKYRTRINSASGVYPIPVYLKPKQCSSSCIYCPKDENLPNSYLQNSDTTLAQKLNFSSEKQVKHYLNRIQKKDDDILQIEIIILGGTFSDYSEAYRKNFVLGIYNALNNKKTNNFRDAKILNETAPNRCSVLTIETRPDKICAYELDFLLSLGVTKIELGIQSFDDNVLKKNNRLYDFNIIIQTTHLIKTYGFKLGFHIMIGLPFSNIQNETKLFNKYLWSKLRPDYLKIYPFVYLGKKYQPMLGDFHYVDNIKEIYKQAVVELKKHIPNYVRISRINRQFEWLKDIPSVNRKEISAKVDCKCIKCKEPYYNKSIDFKTLSYTTMIKDNDIYILAQTNKHILAILRAYIANKDFIIREVKVFGKSAKIGKSSNVQGRGVGKKLINLAIKIAKQNKQNIKILSSTGAMKYYYKLGFIKRKSYLVYGEDYDY